MSMSSRSLLFFTNDVFRTLLWGIGISTNNSALGFVSNIVFAASTASSRIVGPQSLINY